MEHQNGSGREKLEGGKSTNRPKTGDESIRPRLSHSASIKSDKQDDTLLEISSKSSNSSRGVSGTTRPDQGRSEDFFNVNIQYPKLKLAIIIILHIFSHI